MIVTLLYIAVGIAVVLGLGVAVWSFIDTRSRYYTEYMERRTK